MSTSAINFAELEGLKPIDAVLRLAEGLTAAEQLDIALKLLGGLKKAVGKVKAKAPKAEGEGEEPKPKSEGQSKWLAGCARVREVLKADPRYKPTHAMRVASALKEHPAWPETDAAVILGALEAYLEEHPDDASATSGGSKGSSKKSLKEMSDEERKDFYKARAAKAAATKVAKAAATKATKKVAEVGGAGASNAAGGGPAAALDEDFEEADEADEEEPSLQPKPIELDFGKGKKAFGYVDHVGTRYIFDTEGKLLGALNDATGKLRKVKPEENPFA